jgi:putative membrane protein
MFELILALIIGIIAGVITGIIPGIHTNLVSAFLVSISFTLLNIFSPLALAIFIIAMSITNSFIDFIPSIYLGAPEEDTALTTLPGHRFLLEGKGHEAVKLALIGSILGIILLFFTALAIFFIVYPFDAFLQKMMGWILIGICIFLVMENPTSKFLATTIFILSGFLGIASLNLNITQPLLPLLTGLFGTSTIIFSISQKTKVPEQEISEVKLNKNILTKPSIATILISPLCGFLPGLGSSQATIIGSKIFKKISEEQFLILNGAINSSIMALSFFVLYLTEKSRTGSAAAISQFLTITPQILFCLLITIIVTSVVSYFLAINISKIFAKNISRIDYGKTSWFILIFLIITVFLISGFLGMLVLTTATFLGLTAQYYGIRKGLLMGCLLVPTILFYLPF